jgi:hypothetical protein
LFSNLLRNAHLAYLRGSGYIGDLVNGFIASFQTGKTDMPPTQDENQAAPAADRAAPAPGKMRVEDVTMAMLGDERLSALEQANMDRRIKGLPAWLLPDFVRTHPDKFADVDFELDHAEHAQRAAAAPAPAAVNRLDQRPVR